jgi:MoxR-like ATPase
MNQSEHPEQPDYTPSDEYTSRLDLSGFHQAIEQVKAEVGKILVGQHEMAELMLAALLADGHVLIEGVPGVAKTLAAKLLARALSARFSRIQFTPDLMPSDVLGTSVFNAKSSDFEFRAGPIFAQIILIDEINRAPAKTQAALFEAMEERQITIDGHTYQLEPPFFVLATQNPIEQEGTYRLPEAQLDRFLFKILVDYPDADEEIRILNSSQLRRNAHDLSQVEAVLESQQVRQFQATVRQVHIEPRLISYIVELIQHTRNSRDIYLGGSPRASLNIMNTAKAIAAMRGRDFVTPEDIQYVAVPVLRHRIMLTPEKEMEGTSADTVIRRLMETLAIPR